MQRAVPWKPVALVSTTIAVLLTLLLLPACCCLRKGMPAVKLPEPPPSRIPEIGSVDIPTPTEAQAHAPTEAMMRNVDFHIDATTVLHIHSLRGQFVAKEGVKPEQNDLLLEPTTILPPPQIDARLVDVHIEGSELMQVFDAGMHLPDLQLPYPNEKNVMYYRHGTLRMGKLLMVDADMEVTDTDPRDPFDFFIDRYNDQLAAGFEHNTPQYGLMVFMRDFKNLGLPFKPGEIKPNP